MEIIQKKNPWRFWTHIYKIAIKKAGDGNRTHVSSLEGWCSTIELHPHVYIWSRAAILINGVLRNAQNRNRTSDTRIFSPLLYQLSYLGILDLNLHSDLSSGDRIWTYDLRVMSPTSFQTAPPRDINKKEMGGGGFEPPKHYAADLQSVPFGHSGIHPFFAFQQKADDRTRTDNLLITNQLLCQLSHIGLAN